MKCMSHERETHTQRERQTTLHVLATNYYYYKVEIIAIFFFEINQY